jgi:hypothetical protein
MSTCRCAMPASYRDGPTGPSRVYERKKRIEHSSVLVASRILRQIECSRRAACKTSVRRMTSHSTYGLSAQLGVSSRRRNKRAVVGDGIFVRRYSERATDGDGDSSRRHSERCMAMESSHGDTASVQRMVSLVATSEAAWAYISVYFNDRVNVNR